MGEGEGKVIISKLKHTEANHPNNGRTPRNRTLEMMNILIHQTFATAKSLHMVK